MSEFGAVLFDVDGTLVDTPGGMLGVLRAVLDEAGHGAPDARMRATIGRPLRDSFATLLDLPGGHPTVVDAVERARQLFTERVIPAAAALVFPGVPDLLAGLRSRGVRLAAVTSKVRAGAEELLAAAGLLDAFDMLSCHGMAARGKPHGDLALLAAHVLDVPLRRCVVVGDAVDDMRMAAAAGMTGYGVDFGVASRDELTAAGAHHVFGSVRELADALTSRRSPVATT